MVGEVSVSRLFGRLNGGSPPAVSQLRLVQSEHMLAYDEGQLGSDAGQPLLDRVGLMVLQKLSHGGKVQ